MSNVIRREVFDDLLRSDVDAKKLKMKAQDIKNHVKDNYYEGVYIRSIMDDVIVACDSAYEYQENKELK